MAAVRDCEKALPDLVSPQPINHHLMELVPALDMAWGRPDSSLVFVALGKLLFTAVYSLDLVREAHGGKF